MCMLHGDAPLQHDILSVSFLAPFSIYMHNLWYKRYVEGYHLCKCRQTTYIDWYIYMLYPPGMCTSVKPEEISNLKLFDLIPLPETHFRRLRLSQRHCIRVPPPLILYLQRIRFVIWNWPSVSTVGFNISGWLQHLLKKVLHTVYMASSKTTIFYVDSTHTRFTYYVGRGLCSYAEIQVKINE